MSKPLRPGQLCLVIGAHTLTKNIGKVVELVSRHAHKDTVNMGGVDFIFRPNDRHEVGWVVRGNVSASNPSTPTGWAMCAEHHLMPIDPPEEKVTETEKEEVL